VRVVAESFTWPFKGSWGSRFAVGSLLVLLLPVAFIPLLGYAVTATRAAEAAGGPPPLRLSMRLITDGSWTAAVLLLLSAPFLLVLDPLAGAVDGAHLWQVTDRALSQVYAGIAATLVLALPWGLLLLLFMPHGTSRFAASGRVRDLFDFPATLRDVRRDFPAWNVVAAAMVTAWVLALACVGLLCVGLLPGAFYAILVSAHASASLQSPTGASRADPRTR
jgi:hypothetical protein